MFRFEHPLHLWALLIIPISVGLYWWLRQSNQQRLDRFSAAKLQSYLIDNQENKRNNIRLGVTLLGIICLIVAWANPQWGERKEEAQNSKSDVFIALDISQSMFCNDVSPNRLERAKILANELTETLKGDRIGLIFFAGNAYLQMPLTADVSAAQMFIKSANPDQAPTQGTAIGAAINLAQKGFAAENKHGKALIVISDGEDHEDDAVKTAQTASDDGLVICTVAVGTPDGGFIPMQYAGQSGVKMDDKGQPVRTRINEKMMQELAAIGHGNYYNILSGETAIASDVQQVLSKLEKSNKGVSMAFTAKESYFQWFLALGMLLILGEFLYRKP